MSLLPQPDNNYVGSSLSLSFLVLLACMFTFRGCVHYFAPDGGSGMIAGIPLETYPEGAVQTIINAFGNYGRYHLIEAGCAWLVIFRWRAWIPLFLLYVLTTQLVAVALLIAKPLPVVPPGQVSLYVLLPLTAIAFFLSRRRGDAT